MVSFTSSNKGGDTSISLEKMDQIAFSIMLLNLLIITQGNLQKGTPEHFETHT